MTKYFGNVDFLYNALRKRCRESGNNYSELPTFENFENEVMQKAVIYYNAIFATSYSDVLTLMHELQNEQQ